MRTLLDLDSPSLSSSPQRFTLELENRSIVSRLFRGGAPRLTLGEVSVDFSKPLSPADSAALTMTPFNSAGGVEPVGVINRIRRSAYTGSQTGRGARE